MRSYWRRVDPKFSENTEIDTRAQRRDVMMKAEVRMILL
jgi:hypothetical protein